MCVCVCVCVCAKHASRVHILSFLLPPSLPLLQAAVLILAPPVLPPASLCFPLWMRESAPRHRRGVSIVHSLTHSHYTLITSWHTYPHLLTSHTPPHTHTHTQSAGTQCVTPVVTSLLLLCLVVAMTTALTPPTTIDTTTRQRQTSRGHLEEHKVDMSLHLIGQYYSTMYSKRLALIK